MQDKRFFIQVSGDLGAHNIDCEVHEISLQVWICEGPAQATAVDSSLERVVVLQVCGSIFIVFPDCKTIINESTVNMKIGGEFGQYLLSFM